MPPPMAYQPIEHYGLIGNMHTAALVGRNGSIDWYCYPHFDSPSVFGAILDEGKGGSFRIACADEDAVRRQQYWPDTNVLITRFYTADGVGQVVDYMPVDTRENGRVEPGEPSWPSHSIVRRVSVVRGSMKFHLECAPAFDYARRRHTCRTLKGGVLFDDGVSPLVLSSPIDVRLEGDAAWPASASTRTTVWSSSCIRRIRTIRAAGTPRSPRRTSGSGEPSATGVAGWGGAAMPVAGVRWSTGRRWS